jgi:cell division protein FtsQ
MKYRPTRRTRRTYKRVVLRSKVKQERRERVFKLFAVLLCVCALSAGGFWAWKKVTGFVFNAECFRIKDIEVRGGKNVSRSEVTALLPFRSGDNLFSMSLSQTENDIGQCKPELKSIRISRRWKKIVVELQERDPIACMQVAGQRLGLDDDNMPFPLRGHLVKKPLPQVDAANVQDRRELLKFIRLFAPESKEIYPRLARLSLEPMNDVIFDLTDGPRVFWGAADRDMMRQKLKRLRQVLEDAQVRFTRIEYVNLRYFPDGRIIVKPYGAVPPGITVTLRDEEDGRRSL